MLKSRLKDDKGVALAFIIVALVVVFMMVAIVAMLANTNVRQAGAQEKGLQAYYIARSGAELAYEAIMTTDLLDELRANDKKTLEERDIDFEDGTADVFVKTEKDTGFDDERMVVIESVGKLNDSNVSRTVTLKFYINYDKYPDMIWTK